MTFLTTVRRSVMTALVRTGRARARAELLRMDDRTLTDAGFSRELLQSGIAAWPWRHDLAVSEHADIDRLAASRRSAERELQQLSDAELDDLAIARVDIPRAVREGRIGIERPTPAAAPLREAA